MNNTEGVFLAPVTAERLVVRVQASNINSDGVPHRGDDTDQDFALVCYNCASQPDFTLAAFPYKLEACAPAVVSPTIQVGEVLTYEHDVTLGLGSLPLGLTGEVSPAVVTPPGEAQLSLALGPEVTSGVYSLVISGTAQVTNVHTTRLGLSVYQPPHAAWQSDAPVRLGQAMRFTATVSGTGPLTYTWDFGGAGAARGETTSTPVYTYTSPGEFVVRLSVTNLCGTELVSDTVTVHPVTYLPLILKR
jgi:hypothetical protein